MTSPPSRRHSKEFTVRLSTPMGSLWAKRERSDYSYCLTIYTSFEGPLMPCSQPRTLRFRLVRARKRKKKKERNDSKTSRNMNLRRGNRRVAQNGRWTWKVRVQVEQEVKASGGIFHGIGQVGHHLLVHPLEQWLSAIRGLPREC